VFSELASLAEVAAKGGHAVIADATFMDQAHRSMIQDAAIRAGAPFLGIWLTASLAELERRVSARSGDASDATVAVLHSAAANDPGPPACWHAVDASNAAQAESEVLALAKALWQSHIAL
jgi:uncharacterized protein